MVRDVWLTALLTSAVLGSLLGSGARASAAAFTPVPVLHGDEGSLSAVWGAGLGDATLVADTGLLLRTNDGGKSWSRVKLDARKTGAVWGSGKELYVLGPGAIYHSLDGGTWTVSRIVGAPALRGVWGSGASDVWVAGDRGTLLHTTDHGTSWLDASGRTQATLMSLWGTGSGTLVAKALLQPPAVQRLVGRLGAFLRPGQA